MQELLQKIFKKTQFIPVSNLSDLIWQRVQRRIMIIVSVRFSFYSLVTVLSVVLFYNLLPSIYSEITSSWAGSVVSLIFSESIDNILFVGKDIVYMFIESLPIMSLIVVCGIMFVFTLALRGALSYKRKLINLL